MNKEQFLERLRQRLKHLPAEERDSALRYYREYFDEAGPENEARVLAELGSPEALAAKIIGECAVQKKRVPLWAVILAACASPIALPLAIVAGAVVIVLVITVLAVCVSLIASAVAVVFAGVASFAMGWALLPNIASWLFYVGAGLLAMGLGAALAVGMVQLTALIIKGFKNGLGRWIVRRAAQ